VKDLIKKVVMRKMVYLIVAAVLAIGTPQSYGQDQAAIQKALTSQFVLTKTTADGSDIVTPGSILVLHKDGLQMFSLATKIPPMITYKDGKLGMGFGDAFGTDMALSAAHNGANVSNVPQRKFVSGEKFWITAFEVKDKYVILMFYSDPYQDVRYFGQLKFPYNKKSIPAADDLLKTIAEVVTVEPADSSSSGAAQPQPSAPGSPALAPITPPPPPTEAPPVAPKSIALGQTKDQVVASFGQPQKIVNLGTKEIYSYSDMKVTFVDGKVTDVQ
jgi:hypothetical protein